MKGLTRSLFIGLFVFIAAACSNKDAEKKIAELESRLAEVEGGTAAPATASTPAPAPETKPEGPLPAFEFEENEFDFGTINEGDEVEHMFKFKNVGDAPLIIQSARGSCGCTVPNPPKEPIGVGETGEMLVKFNSKGKPNMQNKTVTITANTWPKTTTVRIKAMVTPSAKAADGASGPVK
ncbi:DUF1573 domain-containing protein [Fulvivirga sp. M361]|uniref:DUF1573 domain-containing protein n=1 Tax=Fulvivirga sp. M361 TaxID=2594266 RepID=UPI00117AAEE2|nr:DUF1573 domain-containing protein [Fulvivirga sp. M361]TRX48902.1 DUF1573 domain-containing protein [Fulvivirga sp. M361]